MSQKFEELVEIMTKLRAEDGCPWDKQQTHQTLRQYLLEETYEVLESIDQNDLPALKEELGDLLLQVVFHAQIANETNKFDINDVIESIRTKLINRHPNVFGDVIIKTAEEQTINWEKLKKKEGRTSIIEGVPNELPALLKAHRIQAKASTVGFDWTEIKDVWGKVHEELNELKEATSQKNQKHIEEEFGDLLFSLVNLSRFLKVNPEDSLRLTINKFSNRFKKVEKELKKRGKTPHDSTLEEMDAIWDQVKKEE
jgi:tetrapyrrole methylase family protein / MazG family protein